MLCNSAFTKERALLSRKPGQCVSWPCFSISQIDCLHSVKKKKKVLKTTTCPKECLSQRSHSPWQRQKSSRVSVRREIQSVKKRSSFFSPFGVCFSLRNEKLNARWALSSSVCQKPSTSMASPLQRLLLVPSSSDHHNCFLNSSGRSWRIRDRLTRGFLYKRGSSCSLIRPL